MEHKTIFVLIENNRQDAPTRDGVPFPYFTDCTIIM